MGLYVLSYDMSMIDVSASPHHNNIDTLIVSWNLINFIVLQIRALKSAIIHLKETLLNYKVSIASVYAHFVYGATFILRVS